MGIHLDAPAPSEQRVHASPVKNDLISCSWLNLLRVWSLLKTRGDSQLFEQIKLATALSEGKTYAPLQLRNIRNKESGEVKTIEIARRIRQWWFISETGKVCIQVKYGSRTLEVAKGKNSVEVSSGAELVKALETLKLATESGEFDTQLENAGLKHRNNFHK